MTEVVGPSGPALDVCSQLAKSLFKHEVMFQHESDTRTRIAFFLAVFCMLVSGVALTE